MAEPVTITGVSAMGADSKGTRGEIFLGLVRTIFATTLLCWASSAAVAGEQVAQASDYKTQLNDGLTLWRSDQPRARDLLSQAFAGALAHRDDGAASSALVALDYGPLASTSAQPCAKAIGDQRSKYLARICSNISPATHPPCNVANSCKLIADEVIRGCQLDEQLGGETNYCAPFLTMAKVAAEPAQPAPTSVQGTPSPPATAPSPAASPRQPAEPQTAVAPPLTQASSDGLSVTDMLIAFVVIALGVMLLIFLFRRLGLRGSLGLIATLAIIGIAFAIHPGAGVLVVLLCIVSLIWHGLKRLFAKKCPKCNTRMKDIGEEVLDREEKHVRKGYGDRAGVFLVEELTVRAWKRCPKCGHETHRDLTRKNELGERLDLFVK